MAFRFSLWFAFLLLAGRGLAPLYAGPLITEFVASNSSGLADGDGAASDWLEIHNPDAEPVELGGWSLTDDVSRPARWVFPATTLAPGAYLVVFASGKNRTVSGQPLHTNFSLSAGGEYLGLYPPGGSFAAFAYAPSYPAQGSDVSYGLLMPTENSGFSFFTSPTPGSANTATNAPAGAVQFSLSSRTFVAGSPLSLTLSTPSPTATIRYTINRSEPTVGATLYGGPVPITASMRVRARAFEPGRPAGPISSGTYLLIDAAAAAFSSPIPIVLSHNFNAGVLVNDVKTKATMMVFEPRAPSNLARLTDLPVVATPGSLERRGSTTAGALKNSMTLELWDEADEDRDIALLGMPADADWVLHAPYEFDRSLIHNDLIYRLSNDAGRYAPRTRFVEHFHSVVDGIVNGAVNSADYFGIYSLQERIKRGADRVDIEKITTADNAVPAVQGGYLLKVDRTGTDAGINAAGYTSGVGSVGLVWVDPKETSADSTQVVTAAQKAWVKGDLDAMWGAMNAPDFMDPAAGYAKYVDVIPTVDNHIFNTAARNLDGLRLSAYWYKTRFGKWTAGPLWDFDRAMGSTDTRENGAVTWSALYSASSGDAGTDFFHTRWYNEMFRDPNFWQQWVDRLDVQRRGAFSTPHVMEVIDELSGPLATGGASSPVARNFQRWTAAPPRTANAATPGTNGTAAGEIAWLKTWWTQRLAFMDGQFIRPTATSLAPGVVPAGSTVSLSSPSTTMAGVKIYYTTDGSDPRPPSTERYPVAGVPAVTTLLAEISPVRATVPLSDIGTAWQGTDINGNNNHTDDFDDSLWQSNAPGSLNGVGFDDSAAGTDFLPLLGIRFNTPVNPANPAGAANTMLGINGSCYIRIPFPVTPAQLEVAAAPAGLTLQVRSDDGFVAYLNGVEVARDRAPAVPAWNSLSAGNPPPAGSPPNTPSGSPARPDGEAITWISFPISSFSGLLKAGPNVLAIHGLNSSISSNDALFAARVVVLTPPVTYVAPLGDTAQLYTGPITVNGPVVITSRALHPGIPSDPPTTGGGGTGAVPNGTGWSALRQEVYLPGAAAPAAANLVISEIHYHPDPPNAAELAQGFLQANDFEFIRLTNTGTQPLNLTGIRFSAGVSFTMPLQMASWLAPGGSVVVVENAAAYAFRYGSPWPVAGVFTGALDDSTDTLVLVDPHAYPISDLTYDDGATWPAGADHGKSLIYVAGDPASSGSWRESLDAGGTGVTTLASFQKRYFPAGGSMAAAAADADGDGHNNFAEYAMGTDPRRPGPVDSAPLELVSSQPLKLRAQRRIGLVNTSWILESSTALHGWVPVPLVPETVPLTPDLEALEWSVPVQAGPVFFRLRITAP